MGDTGGGEPLIVAEGVTVGYELERERKLLTALTDINITVDEGEFLLLLGPSGCGKTTLINAFAGLLKPWEGTLTFDGDETAQLVVQLNDGPVMTYSLDLATGEVS